MKPTIETKKTRNMIFVAIIIALLWFSFFWNPIVAVLGTVLILLLSAVNGLIK